MFVKNIEPKIIVSLNIVAYDELNIPYINISIDCNTANLFITLTFLFQSPTVTILEASGGSILVISEYVNNNVEKNKTGKTNKRITLLDFNNNISLKIETKVVAAADIFPVSK